MDLTSDGKRFGVLMKPEASGGERGSVHVTMLLNFFDEVKRGFLNMPRTRIPFH